jgi:hypothetical protein
MHASAQRQMADESMHNPIASGTSALASLITTDCLVDDIQTSATTHHTIIPVPFSQCFDRVLDLHDTNSFLRRSLCCVTRIAPDLQRRTDHCLWDDISWLMAGQ